jgi:hypothetical protein
MLKPRTTRAAAIAAVCCLAISAPTAAQTKKAKSSGKPVPNARRVEYAFYAGRLVKFHPVIPGKMAYPALVGPWLLGERSHPKLNDKRPNLYFVSPGTQHRLPGEASFNHNDVLSAVPNEPSYFDVYWVIVLDPSLKDDEFTSEQEILLATQGTFKLPADTRFDEIPSAGFLRHYLKISDLRGLAKFQRPDGELPRVAIVSAGFSVKAVAEELSEAEAKPGS